MEEFFRIIELIASGLLGGGLIGLIEFLIRRGDEKADKQSEVLSAIKNIKDQILDLEDRLEQGDAGASRRRILVFDDELRRGIDHSEELFNQILDDIKVYKAYCREHEDYENDKAVNAIQHIKETYSRVKAENKFI